jgi:hypothetical protein
LRILVLLSTVRLVGMDAHATPAMGLGALYRSDVSFAAADGQG